MRYITQWYCRGCKRVRERAAFPPHIDANTRCLDCQRGRDTSPAQNTQEAPAPQPAIVRRSITRRHSTDNRE